MTHIYQPLHGKEMYGHHLEGLVEVTHKIQQVCGLDFFSTEIAITAEKKFVAVDYVNEICDMRLQSQHADGVPDSVVWAISRTMAEHVRRLHVSGGFLDIAVKV